MLNDEWIDIADKLPKDDQYVIMTYNDLVLSGWYQDNRFYYADGHGEVEEEEGITHWMPLPLPPKGKENVE